MSVIHAHAQLDMYVMIREGKNGRPGYDYNLQLEWRQPLTSETEH